MITTVHNGGLPSSHFFIALFIVHKVIKPQACLLAGSIIDIEISCEYSLAVLYQSGVIDLILPGLTCVMLCPKF